MNINLKLVLPLINENTNEKQNLKVDSNLLLMPLYATEEDIVPTFNDIITVDNLPILRKILFNSSLTVLRKTAILDKLPSLSSSDIFMIRRDYTICLVNYQYGLKLSTSSLSIGDSVQSKSLGDFSVTLSSKNSIKDGLSPLISNAKSCIYEMEKNIKAIEVNK